MKVFRWLRRIIVDFLRGDTDDFQDAAGESERELARSRAVAALAVAQARRAELELKEALEREPSDDAQLARLATLLEEARERARLQVATFGRRRKQAAENLERMGQAARAARLNRDREAMRAFVDRAAVVPDRDALDDLEASVRAQAAALDVVEALDAGQPVAAEERSDRPPGEDARARARRLLAEDSDNWL